MTIAPLDGGGRTIPPTKMLNPFEAISQQTVWKGTATSQAELDELCGETSIVMCMRHCAGIWTSAVYLHDKIWPAGAVDGTTIAQMTMLLRDQCETNSAVLWPATEQELADDVCTAIADGYPVIALRYYGQPASNIYHYTVACGYDTANIVQAGPWSGTIYSESYARYHEMYVGPLIVVQRRRKLGDH